MSRTDGGKAVFSRREFLARFGEAGLAAGLACGAVGLLLGKGAPDGGPGPLPRFGDYSAGEADVIAVSEMEDHAAAVRAAIEALGGISNFVKPGEVVLIKPNVGFDRPPWVGATTSPEVVAAVVELCRYAGARQILVTDYPINDPAGCFARSRIGPAARAAGARLLLPREADCEPVRIGGRRLTEWKAWYRPFRAYGVSRVIGVPTAKQHARSVISGSIKNWYGLLAGPRSLLHQDLEVVLADLCEMLKPTLVVMDATRLLLRNGPTGGSRSDVKTAHRIIAGTDQVAIDALTAEWLGQDPEKIEWLARAAARGLGTVDYGSKLIRA